MAKINQSLLVVVALAMVISTEACTSCTTRCRPGRECRILELCFLRCTFQACIPAGVFPRSDACPGGDPVLDVRRRIRPCSDERPCPSGTTCTPTSPGSTNGVCCPCGPAAAITTTTTTGTPGLLRPQVAPFPSLQGASFSGLQAAGVASLAPTDATQTTTRLRCPFFASACGGRRRK